MLGLDSSTYLFYVTNKHFPKRCWREAIDEKVGARIDRNQQMGNGSGDQGPVRDAVTIVLNGGLKPLESRHLIDVQDDPQNMANDKKYDNSEQDNSLSTFFSL